MEKHFSIKGVSCWLRWFLPIAILVTKSDVVMGEGSSSSSSSSGHDCSLYLAKSTIPNAGLGVFAAQDFRIGDVIGNPSIGIPVVDFLLENDANQSTTTTTLGGVLNEYLWDASGIGGFGEALDVQLFLPGVASLINHHSALDNVLPSSLELDTETQRETNPMAGSFTYYHGFTLIAKRDILAGEELFADRHSYYPLLEDSLPKSADYEYADAIVNDLMTLGMSLTDAQWTDALQRIKNEMLADIDASIAAVLPNTLFELKRAHEVGTARLPLVDRTLDWIKTNGQCLDSVREGKSQIPDAGLGAFTTRAFEKGSVVTIAPLVQVSTQEAMDISTIVDASNATQQLLLNYCFGHRKSTMLFCPATEAAMINHYSSSKSGEPNVEIRWSREIASKDYTSGSMQDLQVDNNIESYNLKVMFEYVALKDIHEGEELLLDYGEHWEEALKSHMLRGASSVDRHQISVKTLNQERHPVTLSNAATDNQVSYECHLYPKVRIGSVNWEDFSSTRNVDPTNWPATFKAWYKDNDFIGWYPCRVVEADNDKELYSIEMFDKPLSKNHLVKKYRNVPRDRIRFAEAPYQSDLHLPWAFRQYIPIPDSIFPLRWRDDYRVADSWSLGKLANVEETKALEDEYERELRRVDCGLYLAKSNIPNAGYGTYTAVDIPAGGLVIGSKMPAVPVLYNKVDGFRWPGKDYAWDAKAFNNVVLEAPSDFKTQIMLGLFGALSNAHAGITNLKQNTGDYMPELDRRFDPGAGAFSYYIDTSFKSAYPISAGEELFVSYGEKWFRSRETFANVPLKGNFEEANTLLASIWSMINLEGASLTEADATLFLSILRERVVKLDRTRTRSALMPVRNSKDLEHVIGRNGTALATVEARSPQWFEDYGYCQDHIYVKDSSIRRAGKGAFSRRHLSEGTVVISSPVVTATREFLQMNTEKYVINSKQLFYNYHFGHKNSSVMFFPLNQAYAINHNSKRKSSGVEPNVRVEFSTKEKRSRYFLQRTLHELKQEKYSTMFLDFVAVKDIKPDEEIFLDYGKDWEDAWDKYIEQWKSPCGGLFSGACFASSMAIREMNIEKFNKAYHEWSENHYTACQITQSEVQKHGSEFVFLVKEKLDPAADDSIKESYKGITYDDEGFKITPHQHLHLQYFPCKIMASRYYREEFDVLALVNPRFVPVKSLKVKHSKVLIKLNNLPPKDVIFVPRPLKGDMNDPKAFRHEIELPDEVFPDLWKDL